eukprot:gene11990-12134_t
MVHDLQREQQGQAPGASWLALPNLLSLSRAAAGPWVAVLIANQQWPLAAAITAAAGVTDWLDGYLARCLGHTSKLGSYLDPLADKIFVGCIIGALGVSGMPLFISKANTALVMLLVAGCMTQQWLSLPGQQVLDALEVATASTTAASAVAYAWLYYKGKLLPKQEQGG